MSFRPFASVLLVLAVSTPAHAGLDVSTDACRIESRYDVRIDGERMTFTRKDPPQVVVIARSGAITVDGRTLALDAADAARAIDLERSLRAIVPEAKGVAIEAVGIAFEAIGHASTAFAESPSQARESAERLARTSAELRRAIEAKEDWSLASDAYVERLVEGAVGSLVGELVGNITSQALKVAFSGGDTAALAELEARAASIEKHVEKGIKASARALETRVDRLCDQLRAADAIEDGLVARLPDGSRLDLFDLAR